VAVFDISAKVSWGPQTIAIVKIAEGARAAPSTSAFALKLISFESLEEARGLSQRLAKVATL
jgi:hypothetical protein